MYKLDSFVANPSSIIAWNDATDDMRAGKMAKGKKNRPMGAKLLKSFEKGVQLAKEDYAKDPMDRCSRNHRDFHRHRQPVSVGNGRVRKTSNGNSGEEKKSFEKNDYRKV